MERQSKITQDVILRHVGEIMNQQTLEEEVNPAETSKTKRNEFEPLIIRIERFILERYELRMDEVRNVLEVRKKGQEEYRKDEKFEANLTIELLRNGFKNVRNYVGALLASDFVQSYHPIREYFKSNVKWDGRDRVTELCNCVEIFPDEYQDVFTAQLRKHLLRCIASAFVPGFFNKQCFVIVGTGQSIYKTSFIRHLVPKKLASYSTDAILEWKDKDANIALGSNWIINMDELAHLNKEDTNSLKATLSRNMIKVRRPYDRIDSEIPRLANFLGSTNDLQFLTDLTGNVRWLCFRVTKIDGIFNTIDIDQLWSQLYESFISGEQYQMTREETNENEKRNQAFMLSNPELEAIQLHLLPGVKHIRNETTKRLPDFKTTTDLMKLVNEKGYQFRNVKGFGKALQALGFISVSERYVGKDYPVYGYWIHEVKNDLDIDTDMPF